MSSSTSRYDGSQLNEPPILAHVVLAAHLRPRDVALAEGSPNIRAFTAFLIELIGV